MRTGHASAARVLSWSSARIGLDVLASVAMIAAAGVIIWSFMRSPVARSTPTNSVPKNPISFTGAASLGSPGATVGIIEVSDFECPFCARFAVDTLPWLKKQYIDRGLVRLAYRHLPLPNHLSATKAAVVADCAGRQGRFWEMHDRLFANPKNLGDQALRSHADAVGLDEPSFLSCLSDEAVHRRISVEKDAVAAMGISSTPTFLIGTVQPDGLLRVTNVVAGARPAEEFERVLAKLLAGR
jgi:protein-disulfide isomerase